jgi:hypothetical protein
VPSLDRISEQESRRRVEQRELPLGTSHLFEDCVRYRYGKRFQLWILNSEIPVSSSSCVAAREENNILTRGSAGTENSGKYAPERTVLADPVLSCVKSSSSLSSRSCNVLSAPVGMVRVSHFRKSINRAIKGHFSLLTYLKDVGPAPGFGRSCP